MALKELVKAEASLSAERTFTEAIPVEGPFNVSIAGTWEGTLTVQRRFVSDEVIESEATGTPAGKLEDSTRNFSTNGVRAGDWVHNVTDDTYAMITAIYSATMLDLDGDIMASGESYRIERWWDLASSGEFEANTDAVGEEIEGGVKYRIGFRQGNYTSGTAHVRLSQ